MILVFLGTSISAFAQQDKHEQIKSMRVAVYTRILQLTPAEAEKFWPVFNKYQQERDELRKEVKADREKARNMDKLSDAEVEAMVDRHLQHEQRELDLKKKYTSEFKKVIAIQKVALMPRAEWEFKKELIDILRQHKKNKNGSGKTGAAPKN